MSNTEEKRVKQIFPKSYFRCFCSGKRTIRNWLEAKKYIDEGEDVTAFVHVPGFGIWETGSIISYKEYLFSVDVETDEYIFHIVRHEKPIFVNSVFFYIEGTEKKQLSDSKADLIEVSELLKQGCKITALVEFPGKQAHTTSKIIKIWPSKRKLETEYHSIYKW